MSHPADDHGPESDDDTALSPRPGAEEPKSSEYVSAPTFGERAAVSTPGDVTPADPSAAPAPGVPTQVVSLTVAVPSSGGPPPPVIDGYVRSTDQADDRSANSTGVMFAALAVAAVVIVGGVFILLARGSGDSEVARTGNDSPGPLETLTESVAAPVTATPGASVPIDEGVTTTPPPSISPPLSAAPRDSVAPPVETTTLPLDPAPTATPLPPTRGLGDLGLTQPILDEVCDGRYITFVGSAVGDRPYGLVVDELLGLYPGTNYVWTKACPSLRQEFSNGADIYGVVFGPYLTQQEACNAREFGPADAYVRRISTVDPQDHSITC